MNVKQISTSSCETKFNIDGEEINLWIIVGGTPALGFTDFAPYTQRYPSLEKYDSKHWHGGGQSWIKSYYDHQDPKNVQGPLFDVLPKGEESVKEFLDTYLPKKRLAKERYQFLPIRDELKSKRVHDTDERTFAYAHLDIEQYKVSPVTISSGCYCGRCDEKIKMFPAWWQKMQAFINPIFDNNSSLLTWDVLTEQQYQEYDRLLNEYQGE